MSDTNDPTPISPVRAARFDLLVSAAAINDEPVELDGTPTSPEKASAEGNKTLPAVNKEHPMNLQDQEVARSRNIDRDTHNPRPEAFPFITGSQAADIEVDYQKRNEFLKSRIHDPAVLVDIPQTPRAEELAIVDSDPTRVDYIGPVTTVSQPGGSADSITGA
ncbi:hypothetical protein LTR66_010022 [Elasticomyces elasticus]|nr:hypothetical protein LTR66_010022 [Elasticomyces elasticus]